MQVVGGTLEASTGAAGICAPTGVSQVAGAVLFVHGADNVTAGLTTMIYGQPQSTLTNQVLQKTGLTPTQATVVEATISIGSGGVVNSGTKTALPQLVAVEQTKRVLDAYKPGQGFTGVFDKLTGKISYKASSPGTTPVTLKDGTIVDDVVSQYGGHGPVADAMGGDRSSKLGFSILKNSETELQINWNSRTLNGEARSLAEEFKSAVIDQVKKVFPNYDIKH